MCQTRQIAQNPLRSQFERLGDQQPAGMSATPQKIGQNPPMHTRVHSQIDRPLSLLGVGAMPFSHPEARRDQAAKVWQHAFDLGFNLINTADIYAPSDDTVGDNERLVGAAVQAYGRDRIFVVTKNALVRPGWARDNTPEYLVRAAEASNRALGFMPDAILLHRRNRQQPLAAAVDGLLQVRERGLARYIGLSNIHLEELEEAWRVSDGAIAFVENERSPRYRADTDVLDFCSEHGIGYLAWSPLGGGDEAARLGELYPAFAEVGQEHGVSAQQVALAWLLAQGNAMLPIPAFGRTATADDAAAATRLHLSHAEVEFLNASPAGPGSVYPD